MGERKRDELLEAAVLNARKAVTMDTEDRRNALLKLAGKLLAQAVTG
jgi:hypothetical protein